MNSSLSELRNFDKLLEIFNPSHHEFTIPINSAIMIYTGLCILFQLCLATFALAAPVGDEIVTATSSNWQAGAGGGIIGFIVLVLDIIVFIEVLKSNRPPSKKLLWCLIVLLFPIIGMAVYFLFSHRQAHNNYEPLA
ncbi:hypothetical protein GGR50DRAFT_677526 [Xylaria sp. CBS 124048]|nr:hypothetical protein GGR50DRAFT_677526 [Xylaria sp. CBS 124048]